MENLIQIFSELEDPRDNRGKKYKLTEIMLLAVYGILCGYEDFTNMAYYLKKREEELIKEFGLSNGVPSHDTFSDVFRAIDPHKFMELFIRWTKSIMEAKADNTEKHIAIDGKAIRAAADKVNGGNIPYVVSAFLTGMGISIGQVKVDDKSNEIMAIPELLELIDLENATVTIDAIGTQRKIAEKIIDKKGNYCLQLKKNRKNLFDDVRDYFEYALNDKTEKENITEYSTLEKSHGRMEKRKYYVSADISFIDESDKLPGLKSIGMAVLERKTNDNTSLEVHYHLLSSKCEASEYAKFARADRPKTRA